MRRDVIGNRESGTRSLRLGAHLRAHPEVLAGSAGAIALVAAFGALMLPLRNHLGVATSALIMVVPVVVAVARSGLASGVIATAAGFLVYDFVFIPPYYTLRVGAPENWIALGVYVAVTLVIAQVVSGMNAARREARTRATEVRRLFDVSELLVRETGLTELLPTIVTSVRHAFGFDSAVLLLPRGEALELAAADGIPLTAGDLASVSAQSVAPVALDTGSGDSGRLQTVALVASGKAIGLLAVRGHDGHRDGGELLRAFANHLALALERAQLGEHLIRVKLLEEVDVLRRSLVGAVSHDLRTPLATIKVSASALVDSAAAIGESDIRKLGGLIDRQADRLDRLVANVLDMTRIQSGALELRPEQIKLDDLLSEALASLGALAELDRVQWEPLTELPLVTVDRVLVCQVFANLIDNATRYAPADSPITITAELREGRVFVGVADCGPGIPLDETTSVFHMFNRREAGGRGGLGLAIAHAFVEVHGERIWVDESYLLGARFVFTLPSAEGK